MYKKITHTIVEEHYDHPLAPEMKYTMDCNPPVTTQMKYRMNYNLPPRLEENNATMQLRLASRTLFSHFVDSVRNLIMSITDNSPDQKAIEEQVRKDITALSEVVASYYGETAGKRFDEHLNAIATSLGTIIVAIKNNKSITEPKAMLEVYIKELAKLLDSANMRFWPELTVIGILNKVADQWIIQATAREKKDYKADLDSARIVNEIMVTSSPDGTPSFSGIFANGIIEQFPEKFKL